MQKLFKLFAILFLVGIGISGSANSVEINRIYGWGTTGQGQLGIGNFGSTVVTPTLVGTDNSWKELSSKFTHTLAIKADGTLWAWGDNTSGKLGVGGSISLNSPTKIGTSNNWSKVSAGGGFSFAIKADGTLWAWGDNQSGQYGDGTTIGSSTPTQIGTTSNNKDVSCGNDFTIILKTDGTIWSAGRNYAGQLGNGSTNNSSIFTQIGSSKDWDKVSSGLEHVLAIKNNGTLWSWGAGRNGQLGDGSWANKLSPQQIGSSTWIDVDAGDNHSMSINTDNTLWGWGFNENGRLGVGDFSTRDLPTKIGNDSNWKYIISGGRHTLGIKIDGTLWAWGKNDIGQLGDGTVITRTTPKQIGNLKSWGKCEAGTDHSIAFLKVVAPSLSTTTASNITSSSATAGGNVTDDGGASVTERGVVWSKTPNPTTTNSKASSGTGVGSFTINMTGLEPNTVYYYRSYAINEIGTSYGQELSFDNTQYKLMAVGSNGTDALGTAGSSTTIPTKVGTYNDWKKIDAGQNHNLAIKSNGTLWAWGRGINSQIGNGGSSNQSTPLQIGSDNDWVDVKAGTLNSIGIKKDSTLWMWGATNGFEIFKVPTILNNDKWVSVENNGNYSFMVNSKGELWGGGYDGGKKISMGKTDGTLYFEKMDGNTNWKKVFGTRDNIYAMKTDGTIWAWGWNYSHIPSKISNHTDWKVIKSNGEMLILIKNDGTLWTTGFNYYGEIGRGTTTQNFYGLEKIGTDTDWKDVAAGRYTSYAIKNDGTLWSWGFNNNGELFDGTTTHKTVPTKVGNNSNWVSIEGGNSYAIALQLNSTPNLATNSLSSISSNSATSGGSSLDEVGESITAKGVVWGTAANPTVTLSTKSNDGSGTASFTSNITGLSAETKYFVRAYATNAVGTGYGNERNFWTLSPNASHPISLMGNFLSTTSVSLNFTSLENNGNADGYIIVMRENSSYNTIGFEDGYDFNSDNLANGNYHVATITDPTQNEIIVEDLNFGETYYFMIIPYNVGDDLATTNFNTSGYKTTSVLVSPAQKPSVSSIEMPVTRGSSSMEVAGNVINDGSLVLEAAGIVYSLTESEPTLDNSPFVNSYPAEVGEFAVNISNLTKETTYYFRSYATNMLGTSYGEVFEFTTLALEPTRQTRSITFYKIGKTVLGLKWTKGNGAKRVLIASENPLTEGTYLTDGNHYEAGTYGTYESEVEGAYVVYNDSGILFDVTGLTNNTTYYFRVFDYNGQGQTANYNLTSALSNPRSNKTLRKDADEMSEVGVGYSLNVYPNPAKDVLNIEMNLPFTTAEIIIVDNEGREIYKSNDIKNLLNLDVSNFVNGTYHILVSSDDEAIYNSFVIER